MTANEFMSVELDPDIKAWMDEATHAHEQAYKPRPKHDVIWAFMEEAVRLQRKRDEEKANGTSQGSVQVPA